MTRFSRIFLFALLLAAGTTVHAQTVPAAATLVSPSGAIASTTLTYTWNAVSNASYYYLWKGTAATWSSYGSWYSAAQAGCGSGAGTCSVTGRAPTNGSYIWYVLTWNSSGFGPWSSGMNFTVGPAAATLISPSGTISTNTPAYTWNAVSNASHYVLVDGADVSTRYSASEAGCASGAGTCSITGSALADGSYTWYVRTWNSTGYGPWSSGMSFTVCSNCAPAAATLVSPSSTIATTTPTYTWNAVSNASWYRLWNGTAATWYSAELAGCSSGTGTCSITGSALAAGNYTWYVRTWNSSGYGPWSSGMSFTINPATATGNLNDTGITASQCYQAGSNTLVACNSAGALALNNAQDGMVGRDAAYAAGTLTKTGAGAKGFDFTKITNGGCVQDNVTGLMWEVKTNDGGLRDWNKTYTNYSATYNPSNLYGAATDATGFVTAVNASNLCGYSDWRLPSADELQSIVDYGVASPGPAIDATWFPNTQNWFFWSATPLVGYSRYAFSVDFKNGYATYNIRDPSNGFYVRLVRVGQSSIQNRYTVSADGQEVTDNQTQLIWRRCAEGMSWDGSTCTGVASTFSHQDALQRAAAQASSSGVAWRLPNSKELASIADRSSDPAIDPTAFPATPSDWFWSASPYVGDSYRAWLVGFLSGSINHYYRNNSNYVRLVRAGQ